jgi:uncharacterized protein (TIGR03083 family)
MLTRAVVPTQRTEIDRVAQILRSAGLDAPVPGLQWTVGDVAAHLFSVYGVFARAIQGEDVSSLFAAVGEHDTLPGQVAAVNAQAVSLIRFDSPEQAAEQLALAGDEVLKALAEADFSHVIATPWYGPTVTRSIAILAALVGSETLVHGLDIARGARHSHRIDAKAAALITPTIMTEMMPLVVDQSRTERVSLTYEVRLRGADRFRMTISGGTAVVASGDGPADCVLSLTPAAALLLGFGRMPLWQAVATGQVFAFGRRPWLGPRFPGMFRRP